jgi:hypothetical protein
MHAAARWKLPASLAVALLSARISARSSCRCSPAQQPPPAPFVGQLPSILILLPESEMVEAKSKEYLQEAAPDA